jgi:hypothetical protein
LGACASATVAAIKRPSAKRSFRQAQQTRDFFRSLTLNLIFLARIRQTKALASASKGKWRLTTCTAVASYAGAPSCVCGACAWQFLLSFVS